MKKTRIVIGKDGSIKAEATGYKAGKCLDKVDFLEKLFGKAEKRILKSSYYEENSEQVFDLDGNPSKWCG